MKKIILLITCFLQLTSLAYSKTILTEKDIASAQSLFGSLSAKNSFFGKKAYMELYPNQDMAILKLLGSHQYMDMGRNNYIFGYGFFGDGFNEEGSGHFQITKSSILLQGRPLNVESISNDSLVYKNESKISMPDGSTVFKVYLVKIKFNSDKSITHEETLHVNDELRKTNVFKGL